MESKAATDITIGAGVITAPMWMSEATIWMQFIGAAIGLGLVVWRVYTAYKDSKNRIVIKK
jgi:hypothetical protein